MRRRCDRNRKRSKRRGIHCPIHGCFLDSVSQKYQLYADKAGQLQERGMGRQTALILVAHKTAVPIQGEWLEEFWCDECQQKRWYHVKKSDQINNKSSHLAQSIYSARIAPPSLWKQATGVIDAKGNSSVSEFTRRQSKMIGNKSRKDFQFKFFI
ncbi:MAG: hypothetical protein AAF378_23045 [Cyanobacteria bacterium P01_A01_bin.84]